MSKLTSKRTYEYFCKICGESLDLKRAVEDRDEPVSCSCGNEMLRKLSFGGFQIN